ncbi:hypothetical protein JCM10908_006643 [Rhodotorula pacifica]|uniref:uncharacterized protein n=1 Tax=Rhodotorula pacifica TaxID=1495444 RepID=UPI00317871F9
MPRRPPQPAHQSEPSPRPPTPARYERPLDRQDKRFAPSARWQNSQRRSETTEASRRTPSLPIVSAPAPALTLQRLSYTRPVKPMADSADSSISNPSLDSKSTCETAEQSPPQKKMQLSISISSATAKANTESAPPAAAATGPRPNFQPPETAAAGSENAPTTVSAAPARSKVSLKHSSNSAAPSTASAAPANFGLGILVKPRAHVTVPADPPTTSSRPKISLRARQSDKPAAISSSLSTPLDIPRAPRAMLGLDPQVKSAQARASSGPGLSPPINERNSSAASTSDVSVQPVTTRQHTQHGSTSQPPAQAVNGTTPAGTVTILTTPAIGTAAAASTAYKTAEAAAAPASHDAQLQELMHAYGKRAEEEDSIPPSPASVPAQSATSQFGLPLTRQRKRPRNEASHPLLEASVSASASQPAAGTVASDSHATDLTPPSAPTKKPTELATFFPQAVARSRLQDQSQQRDGADARLAAQKKRKLSIGRVSSDTSTATSPAPLRAASVSAREKATLLWRMALPPLATTDARAQTMLHRLHLALIQDCLSTGASDSCMDSTNLNGTETDFVEMQAFAISGCRLRDNEQVDLNLHQPRLNLPPLASAESEACLRALAAIDEFRAEEDHTSDKTARLEELLSTATPPMWVNKMQWVQAVLRKVAEVAKAKEKPSGLRVEGERDVGRKGGSEKR